MDCVRAIDGGGNGFRRADVFGQEITNVKTESSIETVDQLIDFVKTDLDPQTKGISYAVAAILNGDMIVNAPNTHFLEGVNLKKLTSQKTHLPVVVMNDMEGAVRGMSVFLPEENYFLGITWSSGIGMRLCKNGEIISNCEGGHMKIYFSPLAPLCGCGKRGCAEAILGGEAIKDRVLSEIKRRDIELPEGKHPCSFLDECYDEGELWAVELYELISENMGIFLSNIQTLFCLPLIVWKGTFAEKALKRTSHIIRRTMRENLIDPSWANVKFRMTPGPDNKDALVGCASVF